MLPIEIHDRGRGPELKGTRLTVYDVIPYRLKGYTPEQLAELFRPGYAEITPAHIEALYRYADEHHDELMVVHRTIEERMAKGNLPEIEAKLAESKKKVQPKLAELRNQHEADQQEATPPTQSQ